jgi:hypothetical protein
MATDRIKKLILGKLKQEYAFMGDKHTKPPLKEFPQNWMQGRVSNYHTDLGTGKRSDNDKTNFSTDNSGDPELDDELKDNEDE